ncbi:MAG TPA: phytanoyl-CoA dioxygenase family protein [Acidimicrobiia bacterium]|nr:phytanoyl-CoA dioxygenase family protein [Acidimicrobiia bacterium]
MTLGGARRPVRRSEVARFRGDGFVAVNRAVVAADARSRVRTLLDALFERAAELPRPWVHDLAPGPDGESIPEIVQCAHLEPRLLRTGAYAVALRAARQLLGSPVELSYDQAIFKPAGSDATALHQDLAFAPEGIDVQGASIWLALVDAPESSGCMRFLPDTPDGLLDHEPVGRDALAVVGVDAGDARAYPVPAGGFTAHTPRAVHGSGPNQGPGVRAAWILNFVPDHRSRGRRMWERSLELQGVVVPRRFREVNAAFGSRGSGSTRSDPRWFDRTQPPGQDAGTDAKLPSDDDRAYR